MSRQLNFGLIIPMLAVLLLVIAVSCGGSATSTAPPQTAATATAVPTGPTSTPAPVAGFTPVAEATAVPTVESFGTLNVAFKEFGVYGGDPCGVTFPAYGYQVLAGYESLTSRGSDGNFFGKQAKSWSIGPDNLIWTFNLNEGIPFHTDINGGEWGEMTADDIIYSLQDAGGEGCVNANTSEHRRAFVNPKGSMTAVDDYTVELNTGIPQWDILVWTSLPGVEGMWTVSKDQSLALADTIGKQAASPLLVSTGPYELVEQRTGEFWKFKAVNPHWRKTPEFAEMIFFELPEESTRIANFQTGKIDVFSAVPDTIPTLAAIPDTKFMVQEGASQSNLNIYGSFYHTGPGTDCPEGASVCPAPGWDPDAPWVSSNPDPASPEWENARKVREALAIAIDRDKIIEELFNGEAKQLSMWGWAGSEHLELPHWVWEYDVERAKQLLTEAGYPNGFSADIAPSIRGAPAEVEACEAVADMWADIGVTAGIRRIPFGTLVNEHIQRTGKGFTCHAAAPYLEPVVLWNFTWSVVSNYSAGVDHPYITPRFTAANDTFDPPTRQKIQQELGDWVWDNKLSIGLYVSNGIYALGPKVDPWTEHMERNDPRRISGMEWAIHRK